LIRFSIFTGEKIPKFEEIVNSTISYNISSNVEINAVVDIFGISASRSDNCSLLYLTDNISVLKCGDIYAKREGNYLISCENLENSWDCTENLEPFTRYANTSISTLSDISSINDPRAFFDLGYYLNGTNYTVDGSWIENVNKRPAYCYNITIYYSIENMTTSSSSYSVNLVINASACYDKQTRFPVRIEINAGSELLSFYYRYEVENLTINPKYEDYSDMLKPPSKITIYDYEAYAEVYNNSLNISTSVMNEYGISEKVEEVVLRYLAYSNYNINEEKYTINNCIRKGSDIICPINETLEEIIRANEPEIDIYTENYEIILPFPKYVFG